MTKTKILSLNTKITIAFISIGFILLAILFIQIIPQLIVEQKEEKQDQMEHMVVLTQNQLKFARELLINERKESIVKLEKWFNTQSAHAIILLNQQQDPQTIIENLNKQTSCSSYILNEDNKTLFQAGKSVLENSKKELLKEKSIYFYTDAQRHMCPKRTRSLIFQHSLNNGNKLVLECAPRYFKSEHDSLEKRIKDDLQESFKITYEDHKGKINLLWLNSQHKYFKTQPLFHANDKTYNEKYCMSKMSSSIHPQTGSLTGKQILDAANKEPISHKIYIHNDPSNVKDALTWVKVLHDVGDKKFLFLVTVFEEDFNKNLYEPLLKIMPAGVFALITAILLGFIIFRRMFKSINVLTHTVKEVNEGNRSIRNNLKGDDDIAILAKSFDSMMDSIEQNIQELDDKVEDKTKALQSSLAEKETLLKEIHHRVKNNLAMTINLIKLQKVKLKDEKSKEVLTDIQERIFSMELLHKKLYESNDLNSISMKKYIHELTQDLYQTYKTDTIIELQYDIDDIFVDIEHAMPCGLIITECLINSFKYAFDSNNGTIFIAFKQKENHVELTISDDGIGLPEQLDIFKSKSLGLRLITSIVKNQLLGDIEHINVNGVMFIIRFKLEH